MRIATAFVALAAAAASVSASQLAKLTATDGVAADEFGIAVAIDGATAVIGSWNDDDNGISSGSAYLFDAATGSPITKLLPTDGVATAFFGGSVGVSGSVVIIGAAGDDDLGIFSGSAYLFDTAGAPLDKLLPTDGADFDQFGVAVAIDGTTAIAGSWNDDDNGDASGSAYLFDTATGLQSFKLLPADGATSDAFGASVAVSGTTAIVGAPGDDDNGAESGSAYLFDTTTGLQLFKLLPTDGAAGDQFGNAVAVSGTIAIVGAPYDADSGADSGAAYLFDTTTGLQIAKLTPGDAAAGQWFGASVAINGGTVIVGAPYDAELGAGAGAAYLFDSSGAPLGKLLADDTASGDALGGSVAISGATALVGAPGDDDHGSSSGSAYTFATASCPADLTTQGAGVGDPGYGVPDGAVTAADLQYFVNAWIAGDLAIADITTQGAGSGDPGYGVPDGGVTAADLNYYVNLWVAGCP